MRLLDEQYTRTPFYGIQKMTAWLRTQGQEVNHKRVARLLRQMGLMAIYPAPHLSQPGEPAMRYPYLLRGSRLITSIKSGVRMSLTFACKEASCIWSPLWTGSVAMYAAGAGRILALYHAVWWQPRDAVTLQTNPFR